MPLLQTFRFSVGSRHASLNKWFRASPRISNDRSTKRFLAILVNRANRLERRMVAATLTVLLAWEEAAGDAEQAKTLVQGLKRARHLQVVLTRGGVKAVKVHL